jgi:GTP-binding protein Era
MAKTPKPLEPVEKPIAPISPDFRAGYCAIAGIPNAGKSTLMNALLGTKLSIISAKPQTTRKRVLGIFSTEAEQVVFLDTPGIMPRPTTLLHEAMLEQVKRSFADADVILVLAEANLAIDRALPKAWDQYVKIAGTKPIILALSKTDLIKNRLDLLPILQKYGEMGVFKEIIPLSAKKKYNLEELTKTLQVYLPKQAPFFDTEQLSDQNERFFVSELLRETIFHQYGEEIPYSTEVEIEEFAEREKGKWFIRAEIIVERDGQKAIIIGKAGAALKELGERARPEVEKFLDHPVYLDLHVRARSDWRNDKKTLQSFGYTL